MAIELKLPRIIVHTLAILSVYFLLTYADVKGLFVLIRSWVSFSISNNKAALKTGNKKTDDHADCKETLC